MELADITTTPVVLIMGINFSPEITGIAPYTSALARGLRVRAFDVRVLTSHPHYPEWRVRPGYGKWSTSEIVGNVPVDRKLHYVPKSPKGVKRLLSEVSFGLRLLIAPWDNPDVVVLISPALFSCALVSLRARFGSNRPAMNIWVQDLYSLGLSETGSGGTCVTKFVTWVEKQTLNSADGVVVIHDRFASYVTNVLGVDAERVRVVRNWTHLEATSPLDPSQTRGQHGWSEAETVVLHAGNMGVKQGLDNVLSAARLADEQGACVRFVLLGNGSEKAGLIARGADIKRLQFIDSLDDVGFQSALGAADILLVNELPGVSEMAVPSKLTSYFNAHRPVLAATDPKGVTALEIAAAAGGVVVQAGDPQALLDAVVELSLDRARAAALGANGFRYRKEVLGEDAALDRYALWIRGLASLGGRKRGRPLPIATRGNL
ncbi:glycosyltransferase WbuB [Cryobacterium melibiosiphilum]|uniref:Glycosyltransferase WbuB n=2 Tax=Cryobacterium melibiosiphilum TaxID=995039 RepID=A0A3A5MN12_9MICO|nr:glycosyltransferase WbuB [Cryobacterium melibiosiphilum]